jgi:DNA-binding PadR family transcriptional regulator
MSNKLYKGTLSNVVLKLLHENGRMYGYEITKKAKAQTNGGFSITEGALYTILHKLEGEEVLEVEFEIVDGRTRKYYKLSEKGEKEAILKMEELKEFIKNLSDFLNPKLA